MFPSSRDWRFRGSFTTVIAFTGTLKLAFLLFHFSSVSLVIRKGCIPGNNCVRVVARLYFSQIHFTFFFLFPLFVPLLFRWLSLHFRSIRNPCQGKTRWYFSIVASFVLPFFLTNNESVETRLERVSSHDFNFEKNLIFFNLWFDGKWQSRKIVLNTFVVRFRKIYFRKKYCSNVIIYMFFFCIFYFSKYLNFSFKFYL